MACSRGYPRYVTYLGQQGLKHGTIKAYLSGLHLGKGNSFAQESMPQECPHRNQARQALQRLPITINILRHLQSSVGNKSSYHSHNE